MTDNELHSLRWTKRQTNGHSFINSLSDEGRRGERSSECSFKTQQARCLSTFTARGRTFDDELPITRTGIMKK